MEMYIFFAISRLLSPSERYLSTSSSRNVSSFLRAVILFILSVYKFSCKVNYTILLFPNIYELFFKKYVKTTAFNSANGAFFNSLCVFCCKNTMNQPIAVVLPMLIALFGCVLSREGAVKSRIGRPRHYQLWLWSICSGKIFFIFFAKYLVSSEKVSTFAPQFSKILQLVR